MRLARITRDAKTQFAVSAQDGKWHALGDLGNGGTGEVISSWSEIESQLHDGKLPAIDVQESDLLSPVHRPSKIIAIGLNYHEHAAEGGLEAPKAPVAFAKFTNSINAPFADINVDRQLTQELDYEVELAVVIGRDVRRATRDSAVDSIFGYAVANDISARDHQFADGQWDRSKSFDDFCPIGPWITTKDEVPDIQDLSLCTRVNDEVRQHASTSQMVHSVLDLIEYLSRGMTLYTGDVILTGTPSGVGMAMDPPSYLQDGDLVDTRVDGLGQLSNRIVIR